jgi:hypothetical protein
MDRYLITPFHNFTKVRKSIKDDKEKRGCLKSGDSLFLLNAD